MITNVPILTTSHIYFSFKGWENVLFELGSERVKVPLMSINELFYRNLYTFLRTLAKKIIKLIETSSFYDTQTRINRLGPVRVVWRPSDCCVLEERVENE